MTYYAHANITYTFGILLFKYDRTVSDRHICNCHIGLLAQIYKCFSTILHRITTNTIAKYKIHFKIIYVHFAHTHLIIKYTKTLTTQLFQIKSNQTISKTPKSGKYNDQLIRTNFNKLLR